MERNINGEFVPVKLDKNGVPDKYSECISEEGMHILKNYTYKKLTGMAESLFSGDVDAVPDAKIDGINGTVNCNYAYLNFPSIMKEAHLNGF